MANEQKLEDFSALKGLMEGTIKLEQLDEETKIRLIDLCNDRLDVMKQKVEEKRKEADALEKLLDIVKKI